MDFNASDVVWEVNASLVGKFTQFFMKKSSFRGCEAPLHLKNKLIIMMPTLCKEKGQDRRC